MPARDTQSTPAILPLGDAAVLIELGGAVGLEASRRVHALARRIEVSTAGEPGWAAPVPGATSVLVPVDPLEPGTEAAIARLASIVAERSDVPRVDARGDVDDAAIIEVGTRYGGVDGPDLDVVAGMTGLTPEEVVARHASVVYTALFLGFAPGFAYLGPLPSEIAVPRRPVPRTSVPAGSVAIAGPTTAIYPIESPGGWWIIGRTDLVFWDPRRDPPALLRPGARVRFVPQPGRR